ncbi:MAG TPA: MFS transporter [Sphingobium sp.]
MTPPPLVSSLTARQEWSAMWPMPIIGMLGIAGGAMLAYSSGVVMVEMTRAFGWSRAEFASGFTIQMLVGLALAPVVGRIISRMGARRTALFGIIPFVIGFSSLGFANGDIWQWRFLCVLQAVGVTFISPAVWLTAIVGRFNASRGLAIATALAGIGIATAIWPILAALYVSEFGWRLTFAALAISWGLVLWPLCYFCFFGPESISSVPESGPPILQTNAADSDAASIRNILLTRTFLYLFLAGMLFSVIALGVNLHMVPIMQGNGFSLPTAAKIAGLAGILTLAGRIAVGFILDHVPARWVGIVIFLLPVASSLLLLNGNGSLSMSLAAAILFGLASGGEIDLITYIISKRLPAHSFAPVYASLLAVFAATASVGPLLAGAMFDARGSYDSFLILIIPIATLGAILIWLLPPVTRQV